MSMVQVYVCGSDMLFKDSMATQWHKIYFYTYKNKIMADDKNLRDNRDRERVAGNEEYEVNYLAQKLNVSAEEVRRAIEQVGNNREKVEEYLRRGNR